MNNNNFNVYKGTFLFLTWGTNLGPLLDKLGLAAGRFSYAAPGVRRFYSNISDFNFNSLKPDQRKIWLEDTKLALLREGFPVTFKDFGNIKDPKYPAITNSNFNQIPFFSSDLTGKGGVYMLKNNFTKKFYIGKSVNLKKRFNNYLIPKRLQDNPSNINRALLKFGYNNFSLTILEFCDDKSFLLQKEKFYISVFNPQLNIRDSFSDFSLKIPFWKSSFSLVVPQKIIYYLVRSLDPNFKDSHLVFFKVSDPKPDSSYFFELSFIANNKLIYANSKGWEDGFITSELGFKQTTFKHNFTPETILTWYQRIPKKSLIYFLPTQLRVSALKNLNLKIKTLNTLKTNNK